MEAFTQLHGIVAPLNYDNINTDAIIPAEYLRLITRTGFAEGLFKNWRYLGDMSRPNPEFILNQARYQQASILLAGENFGCGSSREHAPWALHEYGFRVIIAVSFGDIFYNNCLNTGLLAIRQERAVVQSLFDEVARTPGYALTIDLATQSITRPDGSILSFAIDSTQKHALLQGLDTIGRTLQQQERIAAYEQKQREQFPWHFHT